MDRKFPHEGHHPLVSLAEESVERYIRDAKEIRVPEELTEEMKEQAGVFVCLKSHGQLRGCIGTFMPTTENVAKEIIRNSIAAATQDPRFACVNCDELEDIEYTVDVLGAPEPVKSLSELDPKRYGVIVSSGHKRGLLLPDLEGVDTVDNQISIAKMKAGIGLDEPVIIHRFEVKRYK